MFMKLPACCLLLQQSKTIQYNVLKKTYFVNTVQSRYNDSVQYTNSNEVC